MVRTQIQLTDGQAEAVKKVALDQKISVAEFIRKALDDALLRRGVRDREEVRRRAIAAVGGFHSGESDIAERHDDYLAEAYAE